MSKQRVARKSLRRPTTFYANNNDDVPPMPRKPIVQDELPPSAIMAAGGGKRYKPKNQNAGNNDGDLRKSRLGEKLKKRLSVKYNYQQPSTFNAGDAPPVPELPNDFQPDEHEINNDGQYLKTGEVRESLLEDINEQRSSDLDIVNKDWLQQQDFDGEAYVRTHLANASPSEIAQFKQALNDSMISANSKLEQNAFQKLVNITFIILIGLLIVNNLKSYADFITISKEMDTIETEVMELRGLLNEWRNLPETFGIEDNGDNDLDKLKRNRSSVADLALVYKNQLQVLHNTVEGSLKFVPPFPGRHVVTTTSKFVELNAATYRIHQSVEIILLNDTLLIASKRRRQAGDGNKEKLIADRAWSFSEITIHDVKDSNNVKNAIKIKNNKQTFVYKAETNNDKLNLLNVIRTSIEEFKKVNMENNESNSSPNLVSPSMKSVGSSVNSPRRTPNINNKYLQWLEDFIDELSVSVALNDNDKAVEQIEKGKKLLRSTNDDYQREVLQNQLSYHKKTLVKNLLNLIEDSNKIKKSNLINVVNLLYRLNETAIAREIFFESRKNLIKRRTRQMIFDGDVVNYVGELSTITFTIIKQSADLFRAAFSNTNKANG